MKRLRCSANGTRPVKCTFRFSFSHFRARRGGPTLGLALGLGAAGADGALLAAAAGLGDGGALGASLAHAPPSLRATVQGLVQGIWFGLGPTLACLVGGRVYQRCGAAALFGGSALVAIPALAVLAAGEARRWERRTVQPKAPLTGWQTASRMAPQMAQRMAQQMAP